MNLHVFVLLLTHPFEGEAVLGGLSGLIYADSLFLSKGRVKGYVLLCLQNKCCTLCACAAPKKKEEKKYKKNRHTYFKFQTFTYQ